MQLNEIAALLESPDIQERMRGIVELRHHTPADAVPLLKQQMFDNEFTIRSFVAMGLGYKQTEEGFNALLNIIAEEKDPNVIAEASNSLSKYGDRSLPHLESIFERHPHWLVRQSIFAAIIEFDCPALLLKLCQAGYQGDDLTVSGAALAGLQKLVGTPFQSNALVILLHATGSDSWFIRAQAARVLSGFTDSSARKALEMLRKDPDHRVVGAALEGLI